MTSSFFSDLDEESKQKPGASFFSDLDNKKSKGKAEKSLRIGAQYGLGALDFASMPLTLASQMQGSKAYQSSEYRQQLIDELERLSDLKRMGQWDEQDEKNLQSIQKQLSNPEEFEEKTKFIKPYDITPSGLVKKGIKETSGYDLEPEGVGEHVAEFAGNLIKPSKLLELPEKAKGLSKLVTKEGREAYKISSQWKALEKSSKGNPQKTEILDFAKEKKLTPEEATLLLQSEGKIDNFKKVAKKTKRFKNIVSGLEKKLSASYEEMKGLGKRGGYVSGKEVTSLQDDLGNVLTDIGKTYVEGPDTKTARKLIEDTIEGLNNKVGTVEDLINTRRNLRQNTNWNKPDEGDAIISRATESIFKAIERKNPAIAKDLRKTDEAWAQYKKFEELLKKKPGVTHIHGLPVTGVVGNLIFLSTGLATGHLPLALKTLAAKEAFQRMSTRMLTDPKFQGVRRKMVDSIKSGSQKNQKGALVSFLKILKHEDPEEYKKFNESIVPE